MDNPKTYYCSSRKMTIKVKVRRGIIIRTAPITHKFVGQSFDNLRKWLTKQGGYREEILNA